MTESHKKGCRRKGCVIPAASIALIVAIFVGREVYLAATAEPGVAVDYHALAEELVASYQPAEGENGWGLLVEAINRMKQMEERRDDWKDDPGYYSNGYSLLINPDADWADEEHESSREEMMTAGREGIAKLREAGVWDLLDQLARSPRVVRPMDQGGVLLDFLLPELGRTRTLAQALAARMRVSHDAGDDADVAAAFVQGCALARAIMHQYTLIDQLVGIAISSLLNEQLRQLLLDRPMNEQSLANIADALEQMTTLPPELPYQGERLFMLDTIQWTHTDDGRGNGRLILSKLGTLQGATGQTPTGQSSLANLASLAFPSKKQTTTQAERFYASAINAAKTPRNERVLSEYDAGTWINQLPRRQILLRMLVPAFSSALAARDQFDALLAGTRTMVAIERFKLREGTYPQSLNQLVPDFLPSLPVDPYATDGRFIYRPLDPTADEFSRAYILYSVAADQADDNGTHDPEVDIKAFRRNATAVDFVFNLPRPER